MRRLWRAKTADFWALALGPDRLLLDCDVAQEALEPWDREIKLLDEICDKIYKRHNEE